MSVQADTQKAEIVRNALIRSLGAAVGAREIDVEQAWDILYEWDDSARLIASLNGQVYDWRRIALAHGYVEGDA